ncbi:site-specific integrase [Desertihabitans brevis]|uniref:Site-specific integrase n=1 Tax=Desertihabitans brevis TaxID=2268447 RepID=A0A367YR67_9ACTN|nr:site-specific integrase [Desertihabitans brevis]RCK68318.1 site-specific integrase [Desertihabitans brevis]
MAVSDRWHRRDPETGKRVRSDRYGRGKRWEVRWWDERKVQRRRAFDHREDAEAFDARLKMSPTERATVRTVAEQWESWIGARAGLKPSTLHGYRRLWRAELEPRWGGRRMSSLRHGELAEWVGELAARSPATARQAKTVLSGVLRSAVADGALQADPTAGISVRAPRADVRPLTVDQVRRLAEECAPHQLVVWVLACTGMRFGEMAALRVDSLDARRRRLRVARNLTSAGGRLVEAMPKNGRSRDVPVPRWLVEQLVEQSAGRAPGEPLLTTRAGGPWRLSSWKRIWVGEGDRPGARQRAGLPDVRTHDLRHTAASWMIESGANVKAVQTALGHQTATMTMDLYAHLFEDGLDSVGDRIDALTR